MKTYTIEQQGMLKILEHIYSILKNGSTKSSVEIMMKTGLESKYWRKLINGGIIDNKGSNRYPDWLWIPILPNIYMAIETLKDIPDYINPRDDKLKDLKQFENLEIKCLYCGKSFFPKRKDAKFCSDKCRVYCNRKTQKVNISFAEFWGLYDKKIGNNERVEKKWNALSDFERISIMEYIPKYKKSQPDKQFRKNPETFLNNKSWNDEIVIHSNPVFMEKKYTIIEALSLISDEQLKDELKKRGWSGSVTISRTMNL